MKDSILKITSIDLGEIKSTLHELLSICFPTTLNFVCLLLLNSINISFISNKYKDLKMIDAIGASTLYVNCTTFIISVGLVLAMDTLCSNALGANQKYLMALYVNRARIISYTFMIFSILFNKMFDLDVIYILTNDLEILEHSKSFIFKYYFALLIELGFRINMSYLSIVNKSLINSIILSITSMFHLLWCYILIYKLNMGISGVAYAMILTQSLNLIFSGLYIYFYNPFPEVYFFVNRDCFRGWKEYLKVAIPIISMLLGDWLGYEIQAIIAMRVSAFDFSVHLILVNIDNIVFSYGMGLTTAVNIRMADMIVSTDINTCKNNLKIWFMFCNMTMLFISLILYSFKDLIIGIYTTDSLTKETLSGIFYILCLFLFIENGRIFLAGVFRGISQVTVPSLLQYFFLYVVNTPLSYFLAIKMGYGVKGIWIAFLISFTSLYFSFIYIWNGLDLENCKQETLKRLENDKYNIKDQMELDLFKRKNNNENQQMYELLKL
jgi:MATE family multidrug resistance protein